MSKWSRLFIGVLMVCFILTSMGSTNVLAENINVVLGTTLNGKQGDIVTARIVVSDNPGIHSFAERIFYDPAYFDYVGVDWNQEAANSTQKMVSGEHTVSDGTYRNVSIIFDNLYSGNGTLATLRFRVKQDYSAPMQGVSLVNREVIDKDYNFATVNNNGSITIDPTAGSQAAPSQSAASQTQTQSQTQRPTPTPTPTSQSQSQRSSQTSSQTQAASQSKTPQQIPTTGSSQRSSQQQFYPDDEDDNDYFEDDTDVELIEESEEDDSQQNPQQDSQNSASGDNTNSGDQNFEPDSEGNADDNSGADANNGSNKKSDKNASSKKSDKKTDKGKLDKTPKTGAISTSMILGGAIILFLAIAGISMKFLGKKDI